MLRRWANNAPNPSRVGTGFITSALSELEEEMIVIALEESARRGWPCGPDEVKLMVQSFLNKVGRKTQLKETFPGEDWMISFKKKWSHQLQLQKTRNIDKSKNSFSQCANTRQIPQTSAEVLMRTTIFIALLVQMGKFERVSDNILCWLNCFFWCYLKNENIFCLEMIICSLLKPSFKESCRFDGQFLLYKLV